MRALQERISSTPNVAYLAAAVTGAGPAVCTTVLRRALLDLRAHHWWTDTFVGGELHVHARPTKADSWKVEARLVLELRPGASLPVWASLNRRWARKVRKMGARHGVHAGVVRAIRDTNKIVAVAVRPTAWLLDVAPTHAAAWGAWAGGGSNLVTRFGSWQKRRAKSDLTVSERAENRILEAVTESTDLYPGALRSPETPQTRDEDVTASQDSPGKGREIRRSPGHPPDSASPHAAMTFRAATAEALAAGALSGSAVLEYLEGLVRDGRVALRPGEALSERAAIALAALGMDDLSRDVALVGAQAAEIPRVAPEERSPEPAVPVKVAARAAHERRIRAGDLVQLKPNRLERFTKHGAFTPAEIASLRVRHVRAVDDGHEAEVDIAAGERRGQPLGQWPVSWFEPQSERKAA